MNPGPRGIWLVALLIATSAAPASTVAATYYVNASSSSCSATGPGTLAQPFCSITAALTAQHAAGTTLVVLPGVYREQVTVPASGTAGSPLVLQARPAATAPVVISGAEDLATAASWVPFSGSVWLAASVTWSPKQVFADSARLQVSTAAPSALPVNSFVYVAGSGLYVNLGGANPGLHHAEVGRRLYGLYVSGRSFVTIDGFQVDRAEWAGVTLTNLCSNVTVSHVTSVFAYRYGIQAENCTNITLASNVTSDHLWSGIALTGGSTGCTVEGNESFRNLTPNQACGIYDYGAPRNLFQRNRVHDNAYNGIFLSTGATGNVLRLNQSWNNGHQGIEDIFCAGNTHIGDVSYGNSWNGFAIEGGATGTTLYNCVAFDNAIATGNADLEVDASSTSGFTSNDNLFWHSTARPIVMFGGTSYTTLPAYRTASGQDSRTLQADPRFVNAPRGDFHPLAGSPLIDSGNSSVANWPSTDAAGSARSDDPATPNTGQGVPAYADRGAYEFAGGSVSTDLPPVAALALSPRRGYAPLPVSADGSASFDPEHSALTYTFDHGDGVRTGPTANPLATHTYAAGHWLSTLTVMDPAANTGTASQSIAAAPSNAGTNLLGNPSFEKDSLGWARVGTASWSRSTGGFDGLRALRLTATSSGTSSFGITDQPDRISSTPAVGTRYRFIAWVRSATSHGNARIIVRESRGSRRRSAVSSAAVTLSPDWDFVTLDYAATWSGASLDLQIVDQPLATGESFEIDALTLVVDPALPAVAAVTAPEETRAPDAALAGDAAPAPWTGGLTPRVSPNPASGRVNIAFRLQRPGVVQMRVFDLSGRLMRTVSESHAAPATWDAMSFDGRSEDGHRLQTGLYLIELRSGTQRAVSRFIWTP